MDGRTSRYTRFTAGAWRTRRRSGQMRLRRSTVEPAAKVFDRAAGVYGRWFVGARAIPATTPSTATSPAAAPIRCCHL